MNVVEVQREHERRMRMMHKHTEIIKPAAPAQIKPTDPKKLLAFYAAMKKRKNEKMKRLAQLERQHNAKINKYNAHLVRKFNPSSYDAKILREFGDDKIHYGYLIKKFSVCMVNGCNGCNSYTAITHSQVSPEDRKKYENDINAEAIAAAFESAALKRKAEGLSELDVNLVKIMKTVPGNKGKYVNGIKLKTESKFIALGLPEPGVISTKS